MIKYTNQFLTKLEDMIAESDYTLRYEKGNFKSGYCLIEDRKIVMINKFAAIESRINTLIEIVKILDASGAISGEKTTQVIRQLSKQSNVEETAG